MSARSETAGTHIAAASTPGFFALVGQAITDVVSRRRLVRYLVEAEIRKRGVNTLLGNLWWVLDPLLLMAVYVVLVSFIRTRQIPDYPLFVFAAVLPWKWFTSAIGDSANSVVGQHRLIKQIAFPKIVLPVAATTAGVVGFAFGIVPLMGIMFFYDHRLSWLVTLIPLIAVVQFVFTLAVGVIVAAANVFFRDLGNVVGHMLRLWFYLSPGLYSLDQVRELGFVQANPWVATALAMNPIAVLFESYRAVIYGTETAGPMPPDFVGLGWLLGVSLVLLASAAVWFKRLERDFAKVL
ncbi:MAG TPA: ABC transporter permease [Candidatus Angelobacter sp.]|nr:ABC transporter permease [Candidatus Angelobacter sp.]